MKNYIQPVVSVENVDPAMVMVTSVHNSLPGNDDEKNYFVREDESEFPWESDF